MLVTQKTLDSYLGHSIAEICPHGYDRDDDNHCAHFVAHALQLDFGYTCARAQRRAGEGANLRVHELFARCREPRPVLDCPTIDQGLIFVSNPSSFRGSPVEMANVPRKHVGILHLGRVWHYSNMRHRVVAQPAGEFLYHYPEQENAVWFGSLPTACRPTPFGACS